MAEVGHRAIIFFVLILWLLLIVVTIVNIYYFTKVYNDGGTSSYTSSQAYTGAVVSALILVFEIISFVLTFYVYNQESKRCDKREELEVGLKVADASIYAINKTYSETSQKLSNDIQDQMDNQVRGVARVINSKNNDIYQRDKQIYEKSMQINDMKTRENMLEDEIDALSRQLDDARNQQPPIFNSYGSNMMMPSMNDDTEDESPFPPKKMVELTIPKNESKNNESFRPPILAHPLPKNIKQSQMLEDEDDESPFKPEVKNVKMPNKSLTSEDTNVSTPSKSIKVMGAKKPKNFDDEDDDEDESTSKVSGLKKLTVPEDSDDEPVTSKKQVLKPLPKQNVKPERRNFFDDI